MIAGLPAEDRIDHRGDLADLPARVEGDVGEAPGPRGYLFAGLLLRII